MTTIPTVQTLRYLTGETGARAPIASKIRRQLEEFDSWQWRGWDGQRTSVRAVMANAALVLATHDVPNAWQWSNGVESLADGIEYVNTGDSYRATLLYDRRTDRFYVTSWGDYVESRERARDDRFPHNGGY